MDSLSHGTNTRMRRRLGVWLLIISGILAVIAAIILFGPGLRDPFGEGLGVVVLLGSICGILLVTTSIYPVNTRNVIYWCAPGLLAIVTFGIISMEFVLPVTFDRPGIPLMVVWVAAGGIAPLTSVGASMLVLRARSRRHLIACVGSWAGAILFWGHGLGLIRVGW